MFLCFYLDDEVDESSTQELFEDKLKDLIDATTEKRYLNNWLTVQFLFYLLQPIKLLESAI